MKFLDPGVTNGLSAPITNTVDTSLSIRSLQYANSNGLPHTTLINPGLTLTITNGFTVGTEIDSGAGLMHQPGAHSTPGPCRGRLALLAARGNCIL